MEIRDLNLKDPWVKTFGTIDGGLELMNAAWPAMRQVFVVRREEMPALERLHEDQGTSPPQLYEARYPLSLLTRHPVDLLTVDKGCITQPPHGYELSRWETLLDHTAPEGRPKVVVEVWSSNAQTWEKGPAGKACRERWRERGYVSRFRRVDATQVGGAIQQVRFIAVRVKEGWASFWQWPAFEKDAFHVRSMSNLLTPPGLVSARDYGSPTGNCFIPDARVDPMPNRPHAWIKTERGTRRLQFDETARGLGLPKEWKWGTAPLDHGLLSQTTSLFLWEYLSETLSNDLPIESPPPPRPFRPVPTCSDFHGPSAPPAVPPFSWIPPNLAPGGAWHAKRMERLLLAAACYPDPERLIADGVRMLAIHRSNYNLEGPDPTQLQLLWWEFPREHWDGLREGSKMNFLTTPPAGLRPNADMDEEQQAVAGMFVTELVELGICGWAPGERPVLLNAPLFVVSKEGQPGEWRVIADMLRGGQNECMGNDPVFLPRTAHILDQMYTGGYSAMVDASKFFYQFPTHPDDRPYLGLLHPVTKEIYEYLGLPMGAANSPALAGRYGLAFVRMLKARFREFQGNPSANCWWTGFSATGEYDPDKGYGYVLTDDSGSPAVKIWVHVDDFLIHGDTYEKTARALKLFLDTAVDVGMLCHPKKLTPPTQVVKYCGFLMDSRGIPCLRIPIGKRERALAVVEHLIAAPVDRAFSRLSLAVAAGILQSLVEATPLRLGHTYLRRFHGVVRPEGLGTGAAPYYTTTVVPEEVKKDLEWWRGFLRKTEGRFARSSRSATLVPNWGDGSGTGTGGTLGLPDRPLKMWKGKWSPVVYKFSSNWKELSTLRLTLVNLRQEAPEEVAGTTVFYFTDNLTTYWVASSGSSPSPRLHALIEEIRLLEMELDCCLQVVHVPGVVMIDQGTDGLSRGIWASPFHGLTNSLVLTRAVFEPLTFDPALVRRYVCDYQLPSVWRYQDWNQVWEANDLFDRFSVWFPPPELARQVLTFTLETWCEQPLTTAALFFIPRTVPAFWWGLSRHLIELATVYPHVTSLVCPPLLPIPIIVLYLAPYRRSLSNNSRLERTPLPPNAFWHWEQRALLRGLPPGILPEEGDPSV